MIGEHKSKGQNLEKAASQAFDYCDSLLREKREDEVAVEGRPESVTVPLDKLHENIRAFDFISGYQPFGRSRRSDQCEGGVEKLGKLHDQLELAGYKGHRLEQFMVRILFCLFAEDTGIFDPDTFKEWVLETREDGSDLGPQLARFFAVLDEKEEDRNASLAEELAALPWREREGALPRMILN